MRLITTSELRKSKEKTKLEDDTLIVCAMNSQIKVPDGEDAANEQSRVINFIISNETQDSYRDVVSADGWDLERYNKNPVVLWAHDKSQLPVARAMDVRVEGDALLSSAEFAERDTYEFADDVFKMLKAGFLNAVSVGFIPLEWTWDDERGGYNFLKCELFEYSVVPVPANPDALQNAIESGQDVAFLKQWCERTLDMWKPNDHVAMWVPKTAVEDIHSLVSGESAVVSLAADEPDVCHAFGASVDAEDVEGYGYEEFWAPFKGGLTPDPADAVKIPDMTVTTTGDEKFKDGYSEIEELKKAIDQLNERLDALSPKEGAAGPVEDPESDPDEITLDWSEILRTDDTNDIAGELSSLVQNMHADADDDEGINIEFFREALRAEAERAIMKRTGKLPKEV
jgi:HK97 family phage prohead protease